MRKTETKGRRRADEQAVDGRRKEERGGGAMKGTEGKRRAAVRQAVDRLPLDDEGDIRELLAVARQPEQGRAEATGREVRQHRAMVPRSRAGFGTNAVYRRGLNCRGKTGRSRVPSRAVQEGSYLQGSRPKHRVRTEGFVCGS